MEDASIAAAAAGDARATICFVAPPVLNDEFLSGAEFLSAFKLLVALVSSLLPYFQNNQRFSTM